MVNEQARSLRKNQTDAEVIFWRAVKGRQLDGFRIRRQHPIGKYVVDFICLEKQLIIELDGEQHAVQPHKQHDELRDAWLESRGYRVIRYWNDAVYKNLYGVLAEVSTYLRAPSYGPPPP